MALEQVTNGNMDGLSNLCSSLPRRMYAFNREGLEMRLPSVKTLQTVAGDRAQEVRELLQGKRKTREYRSVTDWEKQCYNRPRYGERLMCALNEIIGGYGVEGLVRDGEIACEYEYINMGDTYTATIIRHIPSQRISVGCWGDIVERWN